MAAVAAVLIPVNQKRRERTFRDRLDISHLSESEVISRYRLTKDAIHSLVEILREELERATQRSSSIPVLTQVLVGLRFIAKGDFLSEVADLHGISRTSACNIIDNFVQAVNKKLDNIRFPEERQVLAMKHGFYQSCGIPNTVGAIDCTLIPIQAPAENEDVFVTRKNFHGINVQAVVDNKGRFIDAVSKWPGSTHDASIFDNCSLKEYLENNHIGHLLGDSGYPLRRYLVTPILHPASRAETLFNNAQSRGRMVVERAFGILKSRFRCLHKSGGCMVLKPEKCCQVTLACMRLHNWCMDLQVPAPDAPVVEHFGPDGNNIEHGQDAGAAAYRQNIVGLFNNR